MRIIMLQGKDGTEPYREFDKGEQVWIVYFRTLVVRCNIVKVDTYFRNQNESSYLFYDVDEPIGHSLPEDEIYTSKEEAAFQLALEIHYDVKYLQSEGNHIQSLEDYKVRFTETLEDLRSGSIKRITRTHGDHYDESKKAMETMFPRKEHGVDWFNYNDLIKQTKYPAEEKNHDL